MKITIKMSKSYAQKCAAYAAILKANPGTTANEIGERYKGTPLGMRKQDRNDFVKGYKGELVQKAAFKAKIENSDMTAATRAKMLKIADKRAYSAAKSNTRKSKATGDGTIVTGVKGLSDRTFGRIPKHGDGAFVEFYG